MPAPGVQLLATAPGASALVAMPEAAGGGVVVLGGEAAQFVPASVSRGGPVKLDLEEAMVVAGWSVEPEGKLLVSTDRGQLIEVVLQRGDEDEDEDEALGSAGVAMEDGGASSGAAEDARVVRRSPVRGLAVSELGTGCVATSIAPLGDGYYFLGSCFGDSLMVRVTDEVDEESGERLVIEDNYPNLGPI